MFGPGKIVKSSVPAAVLFLMVTGYLPLPKCAAEQNPISNSELLQTIVQRMTEKLEQNHANIRPYTVTRAYTLYGHGETAPKTQVLARVNFLPPNQKSYDIAQTSGGMGEKVVRKVLEHEVEIAKDPESAMMTEQNYNFALVKRDSFKGRDCYLLHASPKRDDKRLIKADVWVDSASFEILHLEGEPVKSPSFWLKDVHITFDFGEVSGMWLQTASQATAHVRFAGDYKMHAQDLSLEITPVVASLRTSQEQSAEVASSRPLHRGRSLRRASPPVLADSIAWGAR